MKRAIFFSAALLVVDQAIKLMISYFFFDSNAEFIPGILSFQPVINMNLTWIASMADYQMQSY